jgi:hypothetical protein
MKVTVHDASSTRKDFAKRILQETNADGYRYRTVGLTVWAMKVDDEGNPIVFHVDRIKKLVQMAEAKDGNAFEALSNLAAAAIEGGWHMPDSLRAFATNIIDKVRDGEKPRSKKTRVSRDQDRNQRICTAIRILCDKNGSFSGPPLTRNKAFAFVNDVLGANRDSDYGGVDEVWKNRDRWLSLLND